MLWKLPALFALALLLSGCVYAAVGAGGAVAVDTALERKNGDDGLF